MDFYEVMEKFLTSKRAGNRAPKTLIYYQCNLGVFLTFCKAQGYSGADLIQTDTIEEFLEYRRAQGLADASVFDNFQALRALCNWAMKRGYLRDEDNPMQFVEAPRVMETLPKRITFTEYSRLLASIQRQDWWSQRDRLIIELLFSCGPRAGELCSMRIKDVDLAGRQMIIRRTKVKAEDIIPFPRSMVEPMRLWIEERRPEHHTDFLWLSRAHATSEIKPLHAQGLQEMLRRRCKAAKIPPYRPHAFRHGCAVRLIEGGADISLVQRILGHRQLATSAVYLKFDTGGVKTMYDRVFS